MHLHILGICGTFMGSLALLARDLGHKVTGSDANVYPPMSTQLENAGIELMQGYDRSHLQPHPDLVIVGNAMKRGIDAIEYMLMKACLIFLAHNFWQIMCCKANMYSVSQGHMVKPPPPPCWLGCWIRQV
jgi:UDP-N-acetylmuramate-alanine ligase